MEWTKSSFWYPKVLGWKSVFPQRIIIAFSTLVQHQADNLKDVHTRVWAKKQNVFMEAQAMNPLICFRRHHLTQPRLYKKQSFIQTGTRSFAN
jgi:hypothetical protein